MARIKDIALTPVESSQIAAIGFADGTLAVQFRSKGGLGATYHYPNVSAETHQKFIEAESKGGFFGSNIKPLREYMRVAEPPEKEAA